MSKPITKGDEYIDSRDVMNRIEEFENDREALADTLQEALETLEEAQRTFDTAKEELVSAGRHDTLAQREAVEEAQEAFEQAQSAYDDAKAELEEWDESEEAEELKDLVELNDMCENESDWSYGAQLIHDSVFEDYAKQFAEDLGLLENCNKWPATCIDWTQAADELKQDYTTIEWGDETYYLRA